MRKSHLIFLAFIVVAMACKTNKKISSYHAVYDEVTIDSKLFKESIVNTTTFKIVSYSIDKQFFKADVLTTENGKHTFKLLWNGMTAKSLPPKASLKLIMETESPKSDDAGIVIQSFSLIFNLSKLSTNYENDILLQINQKINLTYKPVRK